MVLSYNIRKFLQSSLFVLLSVISLGVSTAIFIYLYVFLQSIDIQKAETSIDNWILGIAIVSFLIFLFSVIAPFINKKQKQLRLITSIIYAVYDIILIVAVILIFKFPNKVYKVFKPVYNEQMCYFHGINCCGWTSVTECTVTQHPEYYENRTECDEGIADQRACKDAIKEIVQPKVKPCSITFVVIIILLTLGSVGAFIISCKSGSDSDDGAKTRENMNTPLTYGW